MGNGIDNVTILIVLLIFFLFILTWGFNRISILRIRRKSEQAKDLSVIMKHTLNMSNNSVLRLSIRDHHAMNMHGNFLPPEGMSFEESLNYIHPEDRTRYVEFCKKLAAGEKTSECLFRWDINRGKGEAEWRYYREYNQLRAQLNDDPNAYSMRPSQLPEGIDWIDFQLLLRFVPDAEQIDLAAIRQLSAVVNQVPLKKQWRNLHRLDKYAVEVAILLTLLVLMILTTGNRTKWLFLILYTVFVVTLIIHLSLDGFLKNRVFLCMLLPILLTDFFLLPNTTGLKRRWGIGLAMVVLSGWYGYQIYQETIVAGHNRYLWERLQQPVLAYVPEGTYVTTIGTSMMMEAANPWHIWPFGYHKYTLGWMTCNPLNKPLGHSYRTLLRDDMYIFTDIAYQREHSAVNRICEQIEKHYGVPTRIRPICHNGKYELLQIKVKNEK